MKICTIIGARPQFIKASVICRTIEDYNRNNNHLIQEIIVHTGQHFDDNMSSVFFKELGIKNPDYNLAISKLSHGAMTARMLEEIEKVLIKIKPDLVIVYGDTNSTLAGALAASKLHIPIAHIEAGLRSFNNFMPEEINRIITDRISQYLFCPSETSIKNLTLEGFQNFKKDIVLSGDIMFDQALYYKEKEINPVIEIPNDFIFATIHRPETTNNHKLLQDTIIALSNIAKEFPIVLALHPGTANMLQTFSINLSYKNLLIIDPLSYLETVYMLKKCRLVITDSGGLQKEAFYFGKYCIILRNESEWIELVDNNFNAICGNDKDKIYMSYKQFLQKDSFNPQNYNFYGNGQAAKIIFNTIINNF